MKTHKKTIRKVDDSNEVVTKGFFRRELENKLQNYPTRVELQEELSKYVTKVEFNERMDEVMTALDGIAGQLQSMEREHAYFVARCERFDAKWENHENRILTLEGHSSPA